MSAAKRQLFTLGYEGLELQSFIDVLRKSGVKTVVDVRELPLSRKKGYSKTAFSQTLGEHGIAYLHAPQLGCPKRIRQQYQADGDWGAYTKAFLAYLKTQADPVRELVKVVSATTACLVCFEADFSMCHRTYVARQAHLLGAPSVVHLTAKTSFPDLGRRAAA
jgi:uncharacterized protein (DUF488 family)